MQGLKALVIFLGVLIMAALGGVIYGIIQKLDEKTVTEQTVEQAAEPVAPAKPRTAARQPKDWAAFGSHMENLPAGAEVVSVEPGRRGVFVRYRLSGGREGVFVFDLVKGQPAGTIHLVPENKGAQ